VEWLVAWQSVAEDVAEDVPGGMARGMSGYVATDSGGGGLGYVVGAAAGCCRGYSERCD
jgi:hypothetical protein